jgi:pSer/pThr/pTyr-binding forkhead associated (FHA) protein
MASLIITESPADQVGKHFVIKKRALAAGRDPSQEIQLLDPGVSRKHFVIRFEAESHLLVETQATNGTFVNGEKVSQKKLKDGDTIRVGQTALVYYLNDQDARTDAVQLQRQGDPHLRNDKTLIGIPTPPQKKSVE